MKNETARREIESLDYYLQNHANDYSEESHMAMMMAIKALEQEPKTGHWIKLEPYPLQMHEYKCSECGHETDDNTENYCSECGAYMAESEDEG